MSQSGRGEAKHCFKWIQHEFQTVLCSIISQKFFLQSEDNREDSDAKAKVHHHR